VDARPDLILQVKYLAGECTLAERELIEQWLGQDASRRAELEALRQTWAALEDLRPRPDWRPAFARLSDRLGLHGSPSSTSGATPAESRELRLFPSPTAPPDAAAIPTPGDRPQAMPTTSSARASRRPLFGDFTGPRPLYTAWWFRSAAACLVVAGLGMAVAWPHLGRTARPAARLFVARDGERRSAILADGTRLTLAPGSELRVPAGYGHGRRDVYLEGQASFVVRFDPARAFAVHTTHGVTRDLGTMFVARDYPEDTALTVIVAEGGVALQGIRATDTVAPLAVLGPGQRGDLAAGAAPRVTAVDPSPYFDWTTGRLTFKNAPLGQVVRDMSRWYGRDVRLGTPALGGVPVTGSYTTEPADEVIHAVAGAVGARVVQRGSALVIVRGPSRL
jgi:transmembrane sensor